MAASGFQYIERVSDETGALLAEQEVADFRHLSEDVAFSAVLEGVLPNDGRWGPARIVPLFDKERLAGIRVSRGGCEKSYGLQVFADHASAILHEANLLHEDEEKEEQRKLTWDVRVRACGSEVQKKRLTSTIAYAPFPLSTGTLSGLGIDTAGQSRDIWIAEAVLADLRASASANLDRERAHFLTGRLVAENGQATPVISGMFPAETETGSSATHFGFSPNTFEAARRELQRVGGGAVILGWAHNHPPPCKRDCLRVAPACPSDNLFFSPQDRTVHRAGFSAPYTVAIVVGKAAGRRADAPECCAFGWRDGVIVEKSFGAFGG